MIYLMLIGMVFMIILEIFLGRISLNSLNASSAASDFFVWVQVGIDIYYIPNVSINQALLISMIFSCLCCCHSSEKSIFCWYQQNKSSESKLKFKSLIVAKGSLKLPNLYMIIKQRSPLFPKNLALRTFGELIIVFSQGRKK